MVARMTDPPDVNKVKLPDQMLYDHFPFTNITLVTQGDSSIVTGNIDLSEGIKNMNDAMALQKRQ